LTILRRCLSFLFVVFAVAACTDETPTEVGDDLLPSGEVRTFEVILDPSAFLAFDTTFSGYALPQNAAFSVLANKFAGVVDANVLVRLQQPPPVITVRNTAGNTVVDSQPRFFAGRLVLRVDTLASESGPGVFVRGFRTAEPWDLSATWTLRVDTGNVELPWATPGGTRGPQIDTATWAAGDTIVLDVDSATIAAWRDTANAGRGALIVTETNGARLRVSSAVLRVQARSTIRPDTVVNLDVSAGITHFIFNPMPPAPPGNELRVGGVPTWRTLLGIREDIADLTFPCPGVANCQVNLASAHINRAELLLQPKTPPPGFILEDTTFTRAHTLSVTPSVPLQRSPLGVELCGGATSCILAGRTVPQMFGDPPSAQPVALDITNYLIALVNEDIDDSLRPAFSLALLAPNEPNTFGIATFAAGPRLRIVLTAPIERAQ
jgi:hypothetical protein